MNLRKPKNSNLIRFKAIDSYAKNVAIPPAPASQFIPKWWKEISPFTSDNLMSRDDQDFFYVHATAKKCFPMLDGMTIGYILPLWADVEVSYKKDEIYPTITWLTDRPVFTNWALEFTENMEHPDDCAPMAFKLSNQYIIETPKNWSCLFVQPLGFPNLPFRTIPGVVDTDRLKTDINQPIWIKKDFTGVIPMGTPIAQIIPFERQSWTHEVSEMTENEHYFNHQKFLKTRSQGAYGIYQRVKKSFK